MVTIFQAPCKFHLLLCFLRVLDDANDGIRALKPFGTVSNEPHHRTPVQSGSTQPFIPLSEALNSRMWFGFEFSKVPRHWRRHHTAKN